MHEGLLTRGEVSRLLGISTKTLSAWERDGKIPPPTRDWRGWRGYTPAQVAVIRQRVAARGLAPHEGPAVASLEPPEPGARSGAMLSARNHLRGTIIRLVIEGLMAEVTIRLGDGQEVVALITRSSAQSLGLREGEEAVAVIKSTEVMVGR